MTIPLKEWEESNQSWLKKQRAWLSERAFLHAEIEASAARERALEARLEQLGSGGDTGELSALQEQYRVSGHRHALRAATAFSFV